MNIVKEVLKTLPEECGPKEEATPLKRRDAREVLNASCAVPEIRDKIQKKFVDELVERPECKNAFRDALTRICNDPLVHRLFGLRPKKD